MTSNYCPHSGVAEVMGVYMQQEKWRENNGVVSAARSPSVAEGAASKPNQSSVSNFATSPVQPSPGEAMLWSVYVVSA